ncbi:MAG: RDD family protein [Acidobacteria bacterium]|nr:RDD family protein [Acidobacteriota bacterium]
MDSKSYSEKVYVIKTAGVPGGSTIPEHSARWISPRPNGLRVDRFIDLTFVNINYLHVHAIGDLESGERMMYLAAIGYPVLIQAPFISLSANEFRFPSKNIDQNIRFVAEEIIDKCRFIAMNEETYAFINHQKMPTFADKMDAARRIAADFGTVKDKLPFRCNACRKILWVNYRKLNVKPSSGRCPSCQNYISIAYPEGFDPDLERYHAGPKAGDEFAEELLLAGTGEYQRADLGRGPANQGQSPLPTKPPQAEAVQPPSPAGTGTTGRKKVDIQLDDDFFDGLVPQTAVDSSQTPAGGEYPTGPAVDAFGDDFSSEPSLPPLEAYNETPPANPYAEELGLDDDYFKDIIPETMSPLEGDVPITTREEPSAAPTDEGVIIHDSRGGAPPEAGLLQRTCHMCGAVVGSEKICPNCLAEQLPEAGGMKEIDLPADGSGIEIRLKDEVADQDRSNPDLDPETAARIAREKSGELSAELPYWEQKIWQVKVDNEVFEKLDFQTIEQWILDRSLVETDLIRKGEGKWAEIGGVPYFKNSFRIIQETIRSGQTDAMTSFQPASHGQRILAALIDIIIVGFLFWIGSIIYTLPMLFSMKVTIWDAIMFFIGPHFSFPFLYLSISNGIWGRSLGKLLFQLAVITPDQKTIGLFRGMVRTLFSWGFMVSFFTEKHQSLGDLIAGSYVIQVN